MFGFSLPKILVLLAIIVVVVGAFRIFERFANTEKDDKKINRGTRDRDPKDRGTRGRNPKDEAEVLIECSKCGVFHAADAGCDPKDLD